MAKNVNKRAERFWSLATQFLKDLPTINCPAEIDPPKHFSMRAWARVFDKIQELFDIIVGEDEIRDVVSRFHPKQVPANRTWHKETYRLMERLDIERHMTSVNFRHPISRRIYVASFALFPMNIGPVAEPDPIRKEVVVALIRLVLSNHKEYPTRGEQQEQINYVLEDANMVVLNLKIKPHALDCYGPRED